MNRTARILFLIVLLSVFFSLSTTPVFEGDIFWNIKTGEWIWEQRGIPSEDPFNYTSQAVDPMRPGFVRHEVLLKGYWVSQILYYLIWSLSGIPGIIVLKAGTVVMFLVILSLWMKREEAGYALSILFLCLAGSFMVNISDRPMNFSFLFFPIAAMLLESLRRQALERSRNKVEARRSRGDADGIPRNHTLNISFDLMLLPCLMLLWANMHGGFVMGTILIVTYMGYEAVRILYQRVGRHSETGFADCIPFFMVCLISIAVTFVNPVTYKTYLLLYQFLHGDHPAYVTDMFSPLEAWKLYGDHLLEYWIMIVSAVSVVVLRRKHVLRPGFLAVLVFGVSTIYQRNIPFFLGLSPLIAGEATRLLGQRFRKTVAVAAIATYVMTVAFMALQVKNDRILSFGIERDTFPEGAVAFMKEARPEGKIFNLAEWGGYLMMTLPEYPVFHDGRRLMDDIELAHYSILSASERKIMGVPEWKAYLDTYQIDIIITPSVNPHLFDLYPIVKELYRDDAFSLVYYDPVSLVYLRHGRVNAEIISRYALPKGLSFAQAINGLQRWRTPEQREKNIRTIAELYTLMEKPESAQQYYDMLED